MTLAYTFEADRPCSTAKCLHLALATNKLRLIRLTAIGTSLYRQPYGLTNHGEGQIWDKEV